MYYLSVNINLIIVFIFTLCINLKCYEFWCLTPLPTIFQLYRGGKFIGGGNRRIRRKPLTCRRSRANVVSSTPCHERDSNSDVSGDKH